MYEELQSKNVFIDEIRERSKNESADAKGAADKREQELLKALNDEKRQGAEKINTIQLTHAEYCKYKDTQVNELKKESDQLRQQIRQL